MAKEFRTEAIRGGKEKFASPLYPWGVVGYVDALRDRLRAQSLPRGACNCDAVLSAGLLQQVDSSPFVKLGGVTPEEDLYGAYEEFECAERRRRWRRKDRSTEQYSHWTCSDKTVNSHVTPWRDEGRPRQP